MQGGEYHFNINEAFIVPFYNKWQAMTAAEKMNDLWKKWNILAKQVYLYEK